MQQQNYHCSISAHTSPEEAFESINQVSSWWAKHFEGFSGSLHDVFTVRFGTTYVTFELTEFLPGKKIVWLVTDCYLDFIDDKTEWNGTSVIWELTAQGDTTRIDMTHIGLVPEAECFNQCQAGWDDHIKNSLQRYLTENVGMPI